MLKPHENKFQPLEIDTSTLQGNTETVLNRQNSAGSLHKISSVRHSHQDDNSLQDLSFYNNSNLNIGQGSSGISNINSKQSTQSMKSQNSKQADYYHSIGWEFRKKQDFKSAIENYNKAI